MRRLLPLLMLCGALAGCAHAAGTDATTAATTWVDPSGSASPSPAPSAGVSDPAGPSASTSPAPGPSTTAAPRPTATTGGGLAQQLLGQVNQLRAANGRRAYTLSS